MTIGEIAQLITSIATLIGVIRVTTKVNDVHRATDGIVERLVSSTSDLARNEGHAAGVKEGEGNERS
jgi:uncharacterized membrane protein